jgi:hypothetical protein
MFYLCCLKKETIQSQSKDIDHHQVCVYVMHFSMNNDWIKNAIITGSTASNSVSYWTTETTKFSDHTAYLPDLANNVITNDVMNGEIFYKKDFYHWTIGTHFMGIRWECDDFSYNIADTSHQIWFKQKSTASSSVEPRTDLDCSLTNGVGSYVTMNGKVVYSCNGYVLMLAYNHEANAAVVAKGYSDGTPPMTPTASNAHVLAQALGKSTSDIESVKFFCNTTNHARILHFRTENEKIRSAMVNGVYNPGCSFSCSSAPDFATGYTLLQNHSARLPETTTRSHNTATSKNDFGIYYPMWNGGTCGNCPPAYAWHIAAFRGTGVDPVTDFNCDSERIGDTDATSHQIWVKFANV